MGIPRYQQVAYLLVSFGLVDLLGHFMQLLRFQHMQMWFQVRQGNFLRSRFNYILGLDRRLFETVGIWDLENFSSNHFVLRARLLWRTTRCHSWYLRGQRSFPLRPQHMGPQRLVDAEFQELKALEIPPLSSVRSPRTLWITIETIRMIDTRAAPRCFPDHIRNQARTLTRDVRNPLSTEAWHWEETDAEEISACLEKLQDKTPDLNGWYAILKWCYCHASTRQPKPSRADLAKVSGDYAVIFQREYPYPLGRTIPIHVAPFQIEYWVP